MLSLDTTDKSVFSYYRPIKPGQRRRIAREAGSFLVGFKVWKLIKTSWQQYGVFRALGGVLGRATADETIARDARRRKAGRGLDLPFTMFLELAMIFCRLTKA